VLLWPVVDQDASVFHQITIWFGGPLLAPNDRQLAAQIICLIVCPWLFYSWPWGKSVNLPIYALPARLSSWSNNCVHAALTFRFQLPPSFFSLAAQNKSTALPISACIRLWLVQPRLVIWPSRCLCQRSLEAYGLSLHI
jgi:hypothetical protein